MVQHVAAVRWAHTAQSLTSASDMNPYARHTTHQWLHRRLVILDRAATAAEVRAINSNAPVFAETFGPLAYPKTTLWTDAEGLWALDGVNGNQVLGFSTVNAKSWGGVTLDSGDFILGKAAASVNNLCSGMPARGVLALRNNTTARVSLAADGSGYLANSLIPWDTAGNLTVAGNASIAGWSITIYRHPQCGRLGYVTWGWQPGLRSNATLRHQCGYRHLPGQHWFLWTGCWRQAVLP